MFIDKDYYHKKFYCRSQFSSVPFIFSSFEAEQLSEGYNHHIIAIYAVDGSFV